MKELGSIIGKLRAGAFMVCIDRPCRQTAAVFNALVNNNFINKYGFEVIAECRSEAEHVQFSFEDLPIGLRNDGVTDNSLFFDESVKKSLRGTNKFRVAKTDTEYLYVVLRKK